MSQLMINALSAGYGDVKVLEDISIELKEGEIISVLGANGAGKTTLLKVISGLVKPWSGELLFQGNSIKGLPPHMVSSRGIIQVPEGRQIFPQMTVIDNLFIGSWLIRNNQTKRKELLDSVYELFPILYERQKQLAGTFSGGERQMLAIARGLMADPKILLFDEPSLGLAPFVIENVFDTIDIIHKRGIGILLVEQRADKALNCAHRGYVLENGRVAISGSGKDLLNNEHLQKAYLGI